MNADAHRAEPPLIAHVIHHLGIGGLENGLVNVINRMPDARYRHAIVCLTGYGDFSQRIQRSDVSIFAMNRGEVSLARVYLELYRLFRRLRPAIVHSRNLSGLDALLPAACAGVAVRVHGEHGRDIDDLDGSNRKHRRLKRLFRPLITHYTAVSRDLASYLAGPIGVANERIQQIYNGVDTERFHPSPRAGRAEGGGRDAPGRFVVGTVGRLQPVKDQTCLVAAFAEAVRIAPSAMRDARLMIVGEGPARAALENAVAAASLADRIQLLGARNDVAAVLRDMDLFVLPSLAEGISNTILEAMATGLPVIATRVGGNPELVVHERTGMLVEAGDWKAMAAQIVAYASESRRLADHGRAARQRAEREFSLDVMVQSYLGLYDRLLGRATLASSQQPLSSIS